MKVRSYFLLAAATVSVVGACSSSSTPGPGNSAGAGNSMAGTTGSMAGTTGSMAGTTGTAGAGTGGSSAASCDSVTACGGSVVGTWTVASSCLKVSGALDLQKVFGLTCPSGQVTGSLEVTGTWTGKADGTFTDGTTTTGTEQLTLPKDCLTLSGAQVTCERLADVMSGGYYDKVTCTEATGGGCSCSATVKQTGSMGRSSTDPQKSGNYTTASNALTITQDSTSYSYCVANNKLTLSPQGSAPSTTGTIVLQSGSSGGSGGSGSGGSGAGGATSGGGSGGAPTGAGGGGSMTRSMGPCDIYAAGSTPCAAAYSMVRGLSMAYTGPLYQVRNMSSSTNLGTGGMTKDIGMTADGYADTAMQDAFCMGTVCTVSVLYDQSGNKNDLKAAPAGLPGNGTRSGEPDYESSATKQAVTAGGHKVYALYMNQYEGYRTPLNVKGKNVPVGDTPEGIYMLADGTHYGTQCCWDFGNVTTDPTKYHTMNTLFFGKGFWGKGTGNSPWFEGDFEGGVWAGGAAAGDPGGSNGKAINPNNPTLGVDFAFGTLKTSTGKYALRMANTATATDLTTAYNGNAPLARWDNQGGILLGIGGDNSNNSFGTFFEGAVVAGLPTDATDLSVMKNIQAVGYKKP